MVIPSPDPTSPTLPSVAAFTRAMEWKLDMNRHKGNREGWRAAPLPALLQRLDEELFEFRHAVYHRTDEGRSSVVAEAADVANILMFISDNLGQLGPHAESELGL